MGPRSIMWSALFAAAIAPGQTLAQVGGTGISLRAPNVYDVNRPAVSPYSLLDHSPSGVTNYQTLVRPLIEQRDLAQRQNIKLQQLQQQVQEAKFSKDSEQRKGRKTARSGGFMNYSHYFYGNPAAVPRAN